MSADKRLYEVRVIVTEEIIHHVYADDEADLTAEWNKCEFRDKKVVKVCGVARQRKSSRMIKNKENL
jgi:hypothetical protein